MLNTRRAIRTSLLLPAGLIAVSALLPSLAAQSAAPAGNPSGVAAPARRLPAFPARARAYFSMTWGIDSFSVKAVEQGELIRFSYRVVDADRARSINDKKSEAFLISPAAHAQLVVPALEKVGQLRQSSVPEAGKSYWMAFSNPGRTVKRGDRVNVVIGQFHVDGLVVE